MDTNWNICHDCGFKYDSHSTVRICPLCDQIKTVDRWEIAMYILGFVTAIALLFFWIGGLFVAAFTGPVFFICVIGCLLSRQRKVELMLTKLEQTIKEKENPHD